MNLPFTLHDSFEYTGIWFLPESKERQVTGTLKYSKGEFELETIGSVISGDTDFISALQQGFEPPKVIPVILGISTNATKITITGCHKTGARPTMNGLPTYRYSGHDLYLGWNFDKVEDILFDTMKIYYSNLNVWYPNSGILLDFSGMMNHGLKLNYSPIESIEVKIDENFKLGIETLPEFSNNLKDKEFELKESTLLTIKSVTATNHNEFLKMSRCYSYFLMLAMAKTVHPITITGSMNNYTVSIFPGNYLYKNIPKVSYDNMLFSYNDIADGFETFIQKWKKLWDTYEEIMTVYFSTLLNRGLSTIEIQFLRVAFVLEAYHRRRFPNEKALSDEEHEKMIAEMKTRLSDNRQALEFIERHKKNMFPSFKERLSKLVDVCPYIFTNPELEKPQFVMKISKTRNHYTHISDEPEENVVTDPTDLIYLTHEMMTLMEGCLLAELPFTKDKLKEIIIKNRNIKNYAKEHPLN